MFKEILKEKWSPLASLSINYLTAQKMIELKTSLINELNKKLKRKGLCEAEVERFQSDIADAKSKIKMSEAAAQELRERMNGRLIEQVEIMEERAAPPRPRSVAMTMSTSVPYY